MNAKVFFGAVFVSICSAAQAELAWEKTQIELNPKPGEGQVVGQFKYKNQGSKPIRIVSVKSSCGCTTAALKKADVAPGEDGDITATFTIGNRKGIQQKTVTVETDDSRPPTILLLKAVIPELLSIQPVFVHWNGGEEAKPKIITVKAGKDAAIKTIEVVSSSPEFTTRVEPVSSGDFRIVVQPRQTSKAVFATLTIKPESSAGPTQAYYASARIISPPAAAAR